MERNDFYIIYDWQVQAIGQGAALQVFALLYGLLSANGGEMAVQKSYIMQRTGLTEKQVEYSIKKLCADGLLTYQPNRGRGQYGKFSLPEKRVQKNPLLMYPFNEKRVQKNPLLMYPYNNNNNNNNISSSSSTASASAHTHVYAGASDRQNLSPAPPLDDLAKIQDTVLAWITDNELRLGLLLHDCELLTHPHREGELQNIVEPYVTEFVRGEIISGTDFQRKGRTDTLKHFAAWLRRQTIRHDDNTTTNRVNYPEERERARNARNAQAVAAGLQAARNGAGF